jgi:hypothetical protein
LTALVAVYTFEFLFFFTVMRHPPRRPR